MKRRKQMMMLRDDSTTSLDIYNPQWENETESFLDEIKNILKPAVNSWDYTQFTEQIEYTAHSYRGYTRQKQKTPDQYVTARLLNDSTFFDDSASLFLYRFHGLQMYLTSPMYYSPVLLEAVYELQRQYPDSEHFKYYNPHIDRLKASIEAGSRDYEKAIIIKKKYTSFRKLLERFKGQYLLVDIWATWCQPCLEDFTYKDVLRPYIDQDKITVIYISIDKSEWADRWKQSMKYNKLEGYHVRASEELISDMWTVIGDVEGAVPRYVLIDSKGEIFMRTAPRPSEGKELSNKINQMYSFQSEVKDR